MNLNRKGLKTSVDEEQFFIHCKKPRHAKVLTKKIRKQETNPVETRGKDIIIYCKTKKEAMQYYTKMSSTIKELER